MRYEGYGPGDAAVLADCVTADRERTTAALRCTFARHGGYLGATGAVSYLFTEVGRLLYRLPNPDATVATAAPGATAATAAAPHAGASRRLTAEALEAGAEDVLTRGDGSLEVLTAPAELASVRRTLERRGFVAALAGTTLRSATVVPLTGTSAARLTRLLADLESLEEVRHVYSNAEISDAILARVPT